LVYAIPLANKSHLLFRLRFIGILCLRLLTAYTLFRFSEA
jgi:hypothetical protein